MRLPVQALSSSSLRDGSRDARRDLPSFLVLLPPPPYVSTGPSSYRVLPYWLHPNSWSVSTCTSTPLPLTGSKDPRPLFVCVGTGQESGSRDRRVGRKERRGPCVGTRCVVPSPRHVVGTGCSVRRRRFRGPTYRVVFPWVSGWRDGPSSVRTGSEGQTRCEGGRGSFDKPRPQVTNPQYAQGPHDGHTHRDAPRRTDTHHRRLKISTATLAPSRPRTGSSPTSGPRDRRWT